MAQNLATKFSPKVDERFTQVSLTEAAVNNDYDWNGVNSISVYSVDVAPMQSYSRTGAAGVDRYGALFDAGTTKQTLPLARDRAFNTAIDRRNNDESQNVLEAGKWLARQVREVIVPEIDAYRLAAMATAAVTNSKALATGATNATNAYTNFLTLQESISNDSVPTTGRIAFMTAAYYNFLKQGNFVLDSNDAYGDRKTGKLGTVDGNKVVVVPSAIMPASTDLIITHPSATVGPKVLSDYITHKNAPGINGWKIEGRLVYDAFILANKVDAIAVHRSVAP